MRNPWLCLSIVVVLGVCGLVGTAGMILLPAYGKEIPQALVAIVSGALGALSSFLVSPPRGSVGYTDGQDPPRRRAGGRAIVPADSPPAGPVR